jgi:hypothetical protein
MSTLLVEGRCLIRHNLVSSLLANDLLACCGPVLCRCCVYLITFTFSLMLISVLFYS